MAISVIGKLQQRGDVFDLNSGRYKLGADFRPPTTQYTEDYGVALYGSKPLSREATNTRFSFSLHITAASVTEAERAIRNLDTFLARAGNERDPLFLCYRGYDDSIPEPHWGQFGAYTRYEIVSGGVQNPDAYYVVQTSAGSVPNVTVELVIKPHVQGLAQASGVGTGGLWENHIGAAFNNVRGTAILAGTTNHFTNPIFGNTSSGWNNGWTLTGTATQKENLDPKYILFGRRSARLTALASGTNHYTQSINVGATSTHIITAYVRSLNDASDPTTDGLQIWYGSAKTTTIRALGGGWYRLTASVTGIASSTATGIYFPNVTVPFFVGGMQIEQKSYSTPLVYGDMLGATWAGTVHASTSTRTAAKVYYSFADMLGIMTDYTIRMVIYPHNSDAAANRVLLNDAGNNLQIYIDTSRRVNFLVKTAGTAAQTTALTLTPFEPVVIYLRYTGGTQSITVYENGGSAVTASQAQTLPTANYGNIYVGSTSAPGSHLDCTIAGLTVFQDADFTIATDHAHVFQLVNDDERLEPLPWIYTEDGDNVVDVRNDGSGKNYAVIGGLTGAEVESQIKLTASVNFATTKGLFLGTAPLTPARFIRYAAIDNSNNETLLFADEQGTIDGTANGGQHSAVSVAAGSWTALASTVATAQYYGDVVGREVYGLIRLREAIATTNVQLRLRILYGNEAFAGNARTIATDTSFQVYRVGPLRLPEYPRVLDAEQLLMLQIQAQRTTGASTANVLADVGIWFFNHTTLDTTNTTGGGGTAYIRGLDAWLWYTNNSRGKFRTMPAPIQLEAGKLNIMSLWTGVDGDEGLGFGNTVTLNNWAMTPRWNIL